jgi:pimeloyl-ACP methyl ester carboxylesterase
MHKYAPFLSAFIGVTAASPLAARNNTTQPITFRDIPTSPDLQWTDCYGESHTCVNLEVPLDYSDPSAGSTNVAFLRWSTPNQPAKGDIIINPGGPGGSGVDFVLRALPKLIPSLGSSYNFVGMDPRGVNNSGPNIGVFKDTPALRDYYFLQYNQNFEPRSADSMNKLFVEAGAFGDFASEKLGPETKYANTPAAAQDMLRYIELLAESQGKPREEAKLDYYGVSYGSVLGTTFAAMYPERVGRMVIDGVMDVPEYYEGAWLKVIRQGDDSIRAFCDYCFEAGPKYCAFYGNASSADDIQCRLDAVLEDLEKNPIAVADPEILTFPAVLTHMDLRALMFASSYDSFGLYPALAMVFAELEARNGTTLAQAAGKGLMPPAECDGLSQEYSLAFTKFIIGCTDQMGRYKIDTLEKWEEYYAENEKLSRYLGPINSKLLTLQCRGLNWTPPESQKFYGMYSCLRFGGQCY